MNEQRMKELLIDWMAYHMPIFFFDFFLPKCEIYI